VDLMADVLVITETWSCIIWQLVPTKWVVNSLLSQDKRRQPPHCSFCLWPCTEMGISFPVQYTDIWKCLVLCFSRIEEKRRIGTSVTEKLLQSRCHVDNIYSLPEGSSFYESIKDEKSSSRKGYGLPKVYV